MTIGQILFANWWWMVPSGLGLLMLTGLVLYFAPTYLWVRAVTAGVMLLALGGALVYLGLIGVISPGNGVIAFLALLAMSGMMIFVVLLIIAVDAKSTSPSRINDVWQAGERRGFDRRGVGLQAVNYVPVDTAAIPPGDIKIRWHDQVIDPLGVMLVIYCVVIGMMVGIIFWVAFVSNDAKGWMEKKVNQLQQNLPAKDAPKVKPEKVTWKGGMDRTLTFPMTVAEGGPPDDWTWGATFVNKDGLTINAHGFGEKLVIPEGVTEVLIYIYNKDEPSQKTFVLRTIPLT